MAESRRDPKKPYWLVTHGGDDGVIGVNFETAQAALQAYDKGNMLQAHMVIGPGGVVLKFYGVSVYDLRAEMRIWFQAHVREKFTCCDKGHALIEWKEVQNQLQVCNLCDRRLTGIGSFLRCVDCDYDLCDRCGSKRVGECIDAPAAQQETVKPTVRNMWGPGGYVATPVQSAAPMANLSSLLDGPLPSQAPKQFFESSDLLGVESKPVTLDSLILGVEKTSNATGAGAAKKSLDLAGLDFSLGGSTAAAAPAPAGQQSAFSFINAYAAPGPNTNLGAPSSKDTCQQSSPAAAAASKGTGLEALMSTAVSGL